MIQTKQGHILKTDCEAIVNPVNCVGVCGAGLALAIVTKYPDCYEYYKEDCKTGILRIGSVTGSFVHGKWIVNFPTKNHWKNVSRIEFIEVGLPKLVKFLEAHDIWSVAIPKLGCGLGGLKWEEVKPLIVNTFDGFNGLVELYE